MMEARDEAIGWTAEVQGNKTVVAQHPEGHRVVFGFTADARNEIIIRSVQWAFQGDHDEAFLAASTVARAIARTKRWLY